MSRCSSPWNHISLSVTSSNLPPKVTHLRAPAPGAAFHNRAGPLRAAA